MAKKIFLIILLLFLTSASFVVGAFISNKKTSVEIKRTPESAVSQESNKDVPESNESNIEIVGVKPEETKEEIPDQSDQKSENKFSFAILGDTQYFKPGTNGGYQTAVSNIKKNNPNMIFAVGDLSSCDGGLDCENKYNNWKSVLGNFASKTYPMQGNHDRVGKERADSVWEKVFNYLPSNGPSGFVKFTYSFDFEDSHFVVLDSDKPKENIINETQRNWLESDLSKNKNKNIFVFFHEPAYPTNSKIGEGLDANAKDRDALWNILTKYKVKAVFSGHEHIQSRRKVNGIYQFVFGNTDSFNHLAPKPGTAEYSYIGQAFGMVEVNGDEITVKTYSVQGNLLNSFILPK